MDTLLLKQMPRLLDQLTDQGWVATPAAYDLKMCQELAEHLQTRFLEGSFVNAGVGFGGEQSQQERIRNDQILWLNVDDKAPSIQRWILEISDLVSVLNQHLFLSIDSFDCHFASYQAGSFYKKHLDRFRDESGRVLSIILFLNENWQDAEDGQLLIYDPKHPSQLVAEISPEIGTLVIFRSELILHEVRTTKRRRRSLAGWLKSVNAHQSPWEGNLLADRSLTLS